MINIRIGVLMNSMIVPAWIARSLALILDEQGLEIVVLAKDAGSRRGSAGGRQLRRTYAPLAYPLWKKLDLESFKNQRDAFRLVDMTIPLAGIPLLDMVPKRTGEYDDFKAEDVAGLHAMQIDVLIQFGFGELRGDILSVAACGVWVFQYARQGDEEQSLSDTWEVLTGKPTTRSGLRMISDNQNEILVLQQSSSTTSQFHDEHSAGAVYWNTAEFLPQKLCELRDEGLESFVNRHAHAEKDDSHDNHGSPSARPNKTVITRLIALIGKKLRNKLLDKLYRTQWILLYQFNEKTSLPLPVRDFKQLVPPDDRSWTDPFVYEHEGHYAVFIEEFEGSDNKGHLSVINFDDRHEPILPPVPILKKPYHLSYPHVFEDQGILYILPETSQNRTIELYRAVRFPDAWEFVINLMTDVNAVDTTIWHHEGKYWMFTNIAQQGTSTCDNLFLFYSDHLLSDRWLPHPSNPIVSDAHRARQAGPIFKVDGHWYRPSRDSSDIHGDSVKIHRIDLINEMYYQETQVSGIDPGWDADIISTHTLSHMSGLSCFDAMKIRRRSRAIMLKDTYRDLFPWLGHSRAGSGKYSHPFPS